MGICMQGTHLFGWQGERAPSYALGEASWLRKWVTVYDVCITNRIVLETRILVCKIWDYSKQTSNTGGGWRELCMWKKETATTQLGALLNLDYQCSNPEHKIFQVTETAHEQIIVDMVFHTDKDHRSFFSELKFQFWGKDNFHCKIIEKNFSKVSQLQLDIIFDLKWWSWGFERNPSWQKHDLKTESQNSWGWQWPLEIPCMTCSSRNSTTPGWCPAAFWIPPLIETLQPLQANLFQNRSEFPLPSVIWSIRKQREL